MDYNHDRVQAVHRETRRTFMQEEIKPEEQKAIDRVTGVIARDLERGVNKETIVKKLVSQKWPKEGAIKFVDSVEQALDKYKESPEGRKQLARDFGKHVIYGAFWAAGGAVITIVSFINKADYGSYLLAIGAAGFGIVEIVRGAKGWLKYRGE
jgi:ABC-type phosphonate transport system ATPase subunit